MKTLGEWLTEHNMSLLEFEKLSGVPYQRISEHIRENRPLSLKNCIKIMKATNGEVSVETLRPELKEIPDKASAECNYELNIILVKHIHKSKCDPKLLGELFEFFYS